MAVNKLTSGSVNYQKEGKAKINEIVDNLNGTSLGGINAMLGALPTANPGPGNGFWLNAGVVTKGS